LNIVNLLVSKGAKIDCLDLNNKNVLHYSIILADTKMCSFLFQYPQLMKIPKALMNEEKEWKSPFETAVKYYRFWALDHIYEHY
jgi:ankyrin repeat protein